MNLRLLSFTCMTALFLGATAAQSSEDGVKAVWLYRFTTQQPNEVLHNVEQMGFNRIYVSVQPRWLTTHRRVLGQFIKQAHEKGIEVHATMLEEPRYAEKNSHRAALELIDEVIAFCREQGGGGEGAFFDGIHLDTQVHKSFSGGDTPTPSELKDNRDLSKDYVDLLRDIKRKIRTSALPLDLAANTTWWYNEQGVSGNLPKLSARKLGTYLDAIIPMMYGGIGVSAEDIIGKVEDEVKAKPTLIAVGAQEFATYDELMAAMEAVSNKFNHRRNFLGLGIYHYDILMDAYRNAGH